MDTDYTPYEGLSVTGWPTVVLLRGMVVMESGELVDCGLVGEFIPAEPISGR